jgi:hypothetical protein
MPRKILLCLALTLLALCAVDSRQAVADDQNGVGNVTGVIADTTDKPMVGFSVKLYEQVAMGAQGGGQRKKSIDQTPAPTQLAEKLLTTVVTDANGRFSITNAKTGAYLLKGGSKSQGFLYQEVIIKKGETLDVGRVKLVKT